MKARIQRWGNSLAVRIPKAFAEEAHLTADHPVELKLVDGQIMIAPIEEPAYDLDELLAQVSEDNLHSETDTGAPTGAEVW
jgi:antitoxin MazE